MLETERVKKLVSSASRFSAEEMSSASYLLREKAKERSSEEYIDRLRSWAKQLKAGDKVQIALNGTRIPYGTEGTVAAVYLKRAPAVAWVTVQFPERKPETYYIRHLRRAGSISVESAEFNRTVSRVISGIGL